MKRTFVLLAFFFLGCAVEAQAFTVFNLNVFDQLQGDWEKDFRGQRMKKIVAWIRNGHPDLVVFQEAQGKAGNKPGNWEDSNDVSELTAEFPFRQYVHEMVGKDMQSYGYFMMAKKKPAKTWKDGFFFPGGVDRKTQAALWNHVLGEDKKSGCLGVLSLHLSYQTSDVRQKEAHWILTWLKLHEEDCKNWLVLGDFNADSGDKEIKILLQGGLKSLFTEKKPTVGAYNPIRQIYGKNVPSQTIDWALGWNLPTGEAQVVLDKAVDGVWVSDHAGIETRIP